MSRLAPLLLAALVLLLPACGVGGLVEDHQAVPTGGSGTSAAMSPGEREWALRIFDLLNAERAVHELPELAWHEATAEIAYAHAYDMDLRAFFEHRNPDGLAPADRADEAGIIWSAFGENIAEGYGTPERVMEAWMGSAGHRMNILSTAYTHVGVGVHTDPDGGPWWVQDFLTPLDP